MSGIYYVYMKFDREDNTLRADYGRHLLHFESRWAADELFRALQDVKNTSGVAIWKLTRNTPQFWCYDTVNDGDPWWSINEFQRRNTVPEFNYRFGSTILNDAASGRDFPVLPNPAIGSDWVNGNAFFIRNRRQPELYWFVRSNKVYISNTQRSKFIVRGTDFNKTDKKVLIRKDKITIQAVAETVEDQDTTVSTYVAPNVDTSRLDVGNIKGDWTFADLFENVGAIWLDNSGVTYQRAKYMTNDGGDEWELV
ncbi:hypothetical protein K440DRAFT_551430 [Wilcoxina mikolae CBS 423.85]|nr:hypothetical protein K440DRAFT_551430 [Wilcoxina mikolae CBS 423.85]